MTRPTITALIPAAGRVPEGIVALSHVSCSAMIPVAGRPVAQWTIEYLVSLGIDRVVMAVPRRGLFVEEFLSCVLGDRVDLQYMVPQSNAGLGQTIVDLAEAADSTASIVVLGDTHFAFADPSVLESDSPIVLVDEVEESYRWCVATSDTEGRLQALLDKVPDLPEPLDALIGVYYFPDHELLRMASRVAVAARPGAAMADVLLEANQHNPVRVVRAGRWLDCGNPDRQAASQRALVAERAFNQLTIDDRFGTITKRSTRTAEFIDEINFLRLLPSDLAVLFPRVLDHSIALDDPFVTMEFYGYPSLAELFLFENVDAGVWRRIFAHLLDLITEGLGRYRCPIKTDDVRAMYLDKPLHRLAAIEKPDDLLGLIQHDGELQINGVAMPNLPYIWPQVEVAVTEMAESTNASIVHGDLCFSNVLYDLRANVCKLLDPRGRFGASGLYGDSRYDVAKLCHSAIGRYDFITADLFDLELEGTSVELRLRGRSQHDRAAAAFEEVFFNRYDRAEIVLISGLIFASLPALHYDHPRRQVAMYVQAVRMINEALGLRAARQ